ncbi:MAG: alpha/beta fold hydrolase [Gammaproteobacteria bacterium]|nr:alpha/beta fold hydrolase [Gammaproteobacteria bacterium]
MMIIWMLGTVFTVFIVVAAIYFVAPGVLFNLAMALARRNGGLSCKQVTVDGHCIPYLEGGSGEPLLLLHGFAANKDHWTLIAPLLTRHFHIIAPDIPGFGDSSRHQDACYGLDEQLARIAGFADALHLDEFHLGGNSMGGYLAAMFAARHSGKIKSLWLLAPAGVLSAEPSEMQEMFERGENPLLVDGARAFDDLADLAFTVQPPMPAQFKRPLIKRAVAEAPFNAKIFSEMFTDPVGLEPELEGCDVRSLIVWGDQDRLLHSSGAEILHRLLSSSECRVMSRMGHVPMVERPAETAADYLRFQGKLG